MTLSVDGMWCPSCGFIVEESLARVQGVTDVEVSMWERVAYVTFDDEIATIETLTGATSEVGFPSIPIEEGG